jgi:hypothetical protein
VTVAVSAAISGASLALADGGIEMCDLVVGATLVSIIIILHYAEVEFLLTELCDFPL